MELTLWEQKLLEDLKKFEGLRLRPYNDSLGFATIGYGHLIARRPVKQQDFTEWHGFTKEDAERLLLSDMLKHNAEALAMFPWIAKLDPVRKTVLFGMAFQMGVPTLQTFRNTLKFAENGEYSSAADGMANSLWARQTPSRAKVLVERMRKGTWE